MGRVYSLGRDFRYLKASIISPAGTSKSAPSTKRIQFKGFSGNYTARGCSCSSCKTDVMPLVVPLIKWVKGKECLIMEWDALTGSDQNNCFHPDNYCQRGGKLTIAVWGFSGKKGFLSAPFVADAPLNRWKLRAAPGVFPFWSMKVSFCTEAARASEFTARDWFRHKKLSKCVKRHTQKKKAEHFYYFVWSNWLNAGFFSSCTITFMDSFELRPDVMTVLLTCGACLHWTTMRKRFLHFLNDNNQTEWAQSHFTPHPDHLALPLHFAHSQNSLSRFLYR